MKGEGGGGIIAAHIAWPFKTTEEVQCCYVQCCVSMIRECNGLMFIRPAEKLLVMEAR